MSLKKNCVLGLIWIMLVVPSILTTSPIIEPVNLAAPCSSDFEIADPFPETYNLGSDYIRHPNDNVVKNAQDQMVQDYGLPVDNVLDWLNAIWNTLGDPDIAPAAGSDTWYADVDLAEDFLDDGIFNNHVYHCASYAGFVTGMARSVGIPARLISTAYKAYINHAFWWYNNHMVAEMYDDVAGDWKFISINDETQSHRSNWASSEPISESYYSNYDSQGNPITNYVNIIWGMTSNHQTLWFSQINYEEPYIQYYPPNYHTPGDWISGERYYKGIFIENFKSSLASGLEIDHPSDQTVIENDWVSITWHASINFDFSAINRYKIYRGTTLVKNIVLSPIGQKTITYTFLAPNQGPLRFTKYNYKCVVYDESGNQVYDIVVITVFDSVFM